MDTLSQKAMRVVIEELRNLDIEDQKGSTPLMKSLLDKRFMSIAQFILNSGANVNYKNHQGKTALHMAIENRDTEAINWLLSHQANPHIENVSGSDCCDQYKSLGLNGIPQLENCDHELRMKANNRQIVVENTRSLQQD